MATSAHYYNIGYWTEFFRSFQVWLFIALPARACACLCMLHSHQFAIKTSRWKIISYAASVLTFITLLILLLFDKQCRSCWCYCFCYRLYRFSMRYARYHHLKPKHSFCVWPVGNVCILFATLHTNNPTGERNNIRHFNWIPNSNAFLFKYKFVRRFFNVL